MNKLPGFCSFFFFYTTGSRTAAVDVLLGDHLVGEIRGLARGRSLSAAGAGLFTGRRPLNFFFVLLDLLLKENEFSEKPLLRDGKGRERGGVSCQSTSSHDAGGGGVLQEEGKRQPQSAY